jgi:DNA-binding NtrC family response regulator
MGIVMTSHSLEGAIPAMHGQPRVLVVDDDPGILETMEDILSMEGFEVDVASSGAEAMAICDRDNYGFALLDLTMPGMDGMETLRALKRISPSLRAIVITGYDVRTVAARSVGVEAEAVFQKPLDIEACLRLLKGG